MIGFLVPKACRPPIRLCLFRVRFASGIRFPSVVGVIGLFLGLDDLYPRLGNDLAVELLDPFELSVKVFLDGCGISDHQLLDRNLSVLVITFVGGVPLRLCAPLRGPMSFCIRLATLDRAALRLRRCLLLPRGGFV